MRKGNMSPANRKRIVNRIRNQMRCSLNVKYPDWRNSFDFDPSILHPSNLKHKISREIRRYGKLHSDARTYRYRFTILSL